MVSLLLLLCAAAPPWAAWLEDAVTVAAADLADATDDCAPSSSQRVRAHAQAAAAAPRPARAPVVRIAVEEPAAPAAAPRPRLALEVSPALPQGPPRA